MELLQLEFCGDKKAHPIQRYNSKCLAIFATIHGFDSQINVYSMKKNHKFRAHVSKQKPVKVPSRLIIEADPIARLPRWEARLVSSLFQANVVFHTF